MPKIRTRIGPTADSSGLGIRPPSTRRRPALVMFGGIGRCSGLVDGILRCGDCMLCWAPGAATLAAMLVSSVITRSLPSLRIAALFVLAACSSLPTFEERNIVDPPECSVADREGPSCPAGQLCQAGRCFDQCAEDTDCSALERCDTTGICVSNGTSPMTGVFDAGIETDPCGDTCGAEGKICDFRTGQCVDCVEGTDCESITPICDYAQGRCIAPPPIFEFCHPCNNDDNCGMGARCALRIESTERVCLPECDDMGMCPAGLRCDDETNLCEPPLGTCTQLRRGIDELACVTNADCVPRMEPFEPGTCTLDSMVCRAACISEVGCPAGWMCGGTGYCERIP